MKVLISGRREGKTTKLMDWVKKGIKITEYPYWSRVGIVVDERAYHNLKRQYWGDLEDFDHRIYQLIDFERGRFLSLETLYRMDDLDRYLHQVLHIPNLDGFTMTAEPWGE